MSRSLAALRFALNHLHEPKALRANAAIFSRAGAPTAPTQLRRLLTDAIESLKPGDGDGAEGHALTWRVYEILNYRYLQRSSHEEIADQLGLSVRHLKREQQRALEILADLLRERYHVDFDAVPPVEKPSAAEQGGEAEIDDDLEWLQQAPPGPAVQLADMFPALQGLVGSIAKSYGVRIEVADAAGCPAVAVNPIALRQTLLSLLYVAIRRAAGGKVVLAAAPANGGVAVRIVRESPAPAPDLTSEDESNLAVAQKLAAGSGCSLALLAGDGEAVGFAVTLPAAQQRPVLAIDDNADLLRLLQRYAANTHYRVIGAQTPAQAFALAGELQLEAIVLDIMMPDVDGWEFLARLKQHPLTCDVPVIACTILAQEELALSLGVSAFLRKPVSRQAFLEALDRVTAPIAAGR